MQDGYQSNNQPFRTYKRLFFQSPSVSPLSYIVFRYNAQLANLKQFIFLSYLIGFMIIRLNLRRFSPLSESLMLTWRI